MCATAGYQKRMVQVIAAGTWIYHTQNSNNLDQNIGLNKHSHSLLVHDNTAKCNVSQEKKKLSRNYPRLRCRHERN